MSELLRQIQQVFVNLFDMTALMAVLGQPEITVAAFVALNLVVFVETGLLVGFFLPGDSLLVTAGIVAWASGWPVGLLMLTLTASAVVGDSLGYLIGRRSGPRLFRREKSWLFRPDYLKAAQAFYERHGAKTIIMARFVPIVRTFAPVVAGIGNMEYRRFVLFNVVGGVGWVVSMVLFGYMLQPVLEAPLKRVFGPEFRVEKHVDKIIILVVLASISPMLWAGAKRFFGRGRAAPPAAPGEAKRAA